MKNSILNMIVGVIGILTLLPASLHAQTFKMNTEKSVMKWVGKKIVGQHNGTIQIQKGEVIKNGWGSGEMR